MTINNLERKVYFSTEGCQSRESKTGSEADTLEDCCLLASSTWLTTPVFLPNSGPPVQGWCHQEWDGLICIRHLLRKYPTSLPAGNCYGSMFSSCGSLFSYFSSWCQVDKNRTNKNQDTRSQTYQL